MTFSYYCKISRNFVDSSNWPLAGEQRWLLTSVSLFEVGPRVSAASCGDTGEWRVAAAGPGADLEPCSGDCSVALGAAGCCSFTLHFVTSGRGTWIWVTARTPPPPPHHPPHTRRTLWSQDNNGGRTKKLFITLTKKYDF